VYAAELHAIEMALDSVLNSTESWAAQARNGLVIFADNQAALKALRRPRMPSGQIYTHPRVTLRTLYHTRTAGR
jgi:hypothetical protein